MRWLSTEGLATKPDDLSSHPWSHIVGSKNQLYQVVLCPLHVHRGPPHIQKINVIKILGTWGDGSVDQNPYCSYGDPEFSSQHPHWHPQII